MNRLIQAGRQFVRDEEGVTAIEYGLIAAVIAGAVGVALGPLGTAIGGVFTQIVTAINAV